MTRIDPRVLAAAIALLGTTAHADWSALPGPDGGRVTAIAASTTNAFAAAAGAGVHRRPDAAASWSLATDGIPSPAIVRDIATIGTNAAAADFNGQVFTTQDAGASWSASADIPTGHQVELGVVDGALFAFRNPASGADQSLYVSDGGGASWTEATLPAPTGNDVGAVGATLYAGGFATVHRSDDLGQTWTDVTPGLPSDLFIVIGGSGDAVVVQAAFANQLWRSTDGGASWGPATTAPAGSGFQLRYEASAPGAMIALSGSAPNITVYRSADDGDTWAPLASTGLPTTFSQLNDLATDGTRFFAAFAHGVWTSGDQGATWAPTNGGITAHTVRTATSADATGDTLLAGLVNGPVLRSADAGATWTTLTGTIATIDPQTLTTLADGTVLLGTADSGVFRSADNGASWSTTSGIPTYGSTSGARVQPINDVVELDGTILAATGGGPHFVGGDVHCGCTAVPSGDGVYRSLNGGVTWQRVSNGLPVNVVHLGDPILRPIVALAVDGGVVVAATEAHGVYRSTNLGASWSPSAGASGATAITIHDGVLYLLDDGILRRSTDSGATFTTVATPVPLAGARGLASVNADLVVYAGGAFGGAGLFVSANGGATWSPSGSALDEIAVMTVSNTPGAILAGTDAHGLWIEGPIPGDVNGDGSVGFGDVIQIIGAWGACTGSCPEDLNGDGFVNFADILIVISLWTT
jgi:photosystem II stability/assembly factor-like uncharacterized protein